MSVAWAPPRTVAASRRWPRSPGQGWRAWARVYLMTWGSSPGARARFPEPGSLVASGGPAVWY